MKFCYACHVHISGKPGMSQLLERLVEYAQGRDGVRFYSCMEIADFWLQREGTRVS